MPVLPDPEEDIRILGVPVGRLFWLGPLFMFPLLLAILFMSMGAVAALPIALGLFFALYALFGLDLWRAIYWAVTWWLRPERRGQVVELSAVQPTSGPDSGRAGERPARAVRLFSRSGGSPSAGASPRESHTLAVVEPPAVEYTDPQALWRRWGDALRRALRRGATVQMVTWVEPDWEAYRWERERREVLRSGFEGLGELVALRWVMHRDLSVAVGRRVMHAVRVVPGPGTPGENLEDLARYCGVALAGGGNWSVLAPEARAEVYHRALDWGGWFQTTGGGTPELVALWRGRPTVEDMDEEDVATDAEVVDSPVDNAVDNWDDEDDEFLAMDWGFPGEETGQPDKPEAPGEQPDKAATGEAGGGDAAVPEAPPEEPRDEEAVVWLAGPEEAPAGGDEAEPEPGREEDEESAEALVGEEKVEAPSSWSSDAPDEEPDDSAMEQGEEVEESGAGAHRLRFPRPPLAAVLGNLPGRLRRRGARRGGEGEEVEAQERLDRPARPLVAVWSPVPAGKTTVAAELAAALARGGVSVALLDLDTRSRALGGRLCVPSRTAALSAALASRPIDPLPEPVPVWPGVSAFIDAPDAPPAGDLGLWRLNRLLASGAPDAEWWVVDLPASGPHVTAVLDASWVIILVADLDWSRVGEVRRAYREWTRAGKPVLVVVNRFVRDLPGLPRVQPSEVLGVEPAAVVPFDPAVYSAAVTGHPAAAGSPAVMAAMDELAMAVGRVVLAQERAAKGGGNR